MNYLKEYIYREPRVLISTILILPNISHTTVTEAHLFLQEFELLVVAEALQLTDITEILTFTALFVIYWLYSNVDYAVFLELVGRFIFYLFARPRCFFGSLAI